MQAVTSACIAGVSDVIAQAIMGTPYRASRTLKMMVRSTGYGWCPVDLQRDQAAPVDSTNVPAAAAAACVTVDTHVPYTTHSARRQQQHQQQAHGSSARCSSQLLLLF
jgi:hypothetical protein